MEINRLLEIIRQMAELHQEFLMQVMILSTDENPFSPPPNDELMTRQQVKDYLNISEATYKRKVKGGTLKPMKMPGGDRFYKRNLLTAFNESVRRGRI